MNRPRESPLTNKLLSAAIFAAAINVLFVAQLVSVGAQEKSGIPHTALLKTELPNSGGKEVVVWDTEYGWRCHGLIAPGA